MTNDKTGFWLLEDRQGTAVTYWRESGGPTANAQAAQRFETQSDALSALPRTNIGWKAVWIAGRTGMLTG